MSAAGQLVVEFVGEEHVLDDGDELTFGRAGDLVIDDNRYLHRTVGRFWCSNGVWWLSNLGSSIPLTLSDTSSPSFARLTPGGSMALCYESSVVTFEAGGSNYELAVDLVDGLPLAPGSAVDDTAGWNQEVTTTASSLPLSPEQRLLLVALAEAQLRDPAAAIELPTNRQIASRLGWTITKYNRKLDGLCVKFAAAGVSGLRGSADQLARDRRLRLVDHAVHSGIVGTDDLPVLTNHVEAVRARK